jgi:NAD(P)-dependent dehydrogenase (short-subunit alcohol dehydrogenase family)
MDGGRLQGKVAVVCGAGQTPGATVGNGRAVAVLFAREGARVLAVDRNRDAAREVEDEIAGAGGEALAWEADITDERAVAGMFEACMSRWGHVDVLHNNVGVSLAGGDAPITEIEHDALRRVIAINLESMVLTCKHAIPIMREQRGGVICNISSIAAVIDISYVAYRTSKAGVIALTHHVAIREARHGIRANVILPGLMNTPMAIENRVGRLGMSREEVIAQRDQKVPLGGKMGTAWDVAQAALFLCSDEAGFITGATLTVDGGQSLAIG